MMERNQIRVSNLFNCEAFKVKHITSVEDVRQFANYLGNGLKLRFDPGASFDKYLDEYTYKPRFSKEEIKTGNRLMKECYDVCDVNDKNIYEIMAEAVFTLFDRRHCTPRDRTVMYDVFFDIAEAGHKRHAFERTLAGEKII